MNLGHQILKAQLRKHKLKKVQKIISKEEAQKNLLLLKKKKKDLDTFKYSS